MATIFVSYSVEDRSAGEKIRDFLKRWGHDPLIDIYDLNAGLDLTMAIQAKIASADFFCPILSPNSVTSHWVIERELPHALKKQLRIIPILLTQCNVPAEFREVR